MGSPGASIGTYPDQSVIDNLARQTVRNLRASWASIVLDSRVMGNECFIAASEELAESSEQDGIREEVHSIWVQIGLKVQPTPVGDNVHILSWREQTLLATPFAFGKSLGLLVAGFATHSYPFQSDAEKQFLDTAHFVGEVIRLAANNVNGQQKDERIKLIWQVSRDVATLYPLDKLIPRVVSTIKDKFLYDGVSLLMKSNVGDELLFKEVAAGNRVEDLIGLSIPITDKPQGGIVGLAAFSGKSVLVPNVNMEERYLRYIDETKSELAVPLKVGERLIGVLDVECNEVNGLDENDQFVLEALADQIAIAIENARLYGALSSAVGQVESKTRQLQYLLLKTMRIQEEERKRISVELHDGVTQILVSAIFNIQACSALLPKDLTNCREKLHLCQDLLNKSMGEMHRVIHDLRPLMHGDMGMTIALRTLATTAISAACIEASFEVSGSPHKLSSAKEIAIYRIVQEALQNAVKHAEASVIRVALRFDAANLSIIVEDNGSGFDRCSTVTLPDEGHLGLISMEERATGIGGRLQVKSELGRGTSVYLCIPNV